VDPAVDEVGDALPEGFSARFADKGPLAGVDALVVVQRGQLLERLPAVGAHVRLGARVVQQVFVERLLESETLAARGALVRSFPGVQTLVLFLQNFE